MSLTRFRLTRRAKRKKAKFHLLLLDIDSGYANALKIELETLLPVEVTYIQSIDDARKVLADSPNKFFLSLTSATNIDSEAYEKVDLLAEFNIPVIAIVAQYEDEIRDQLIKRHVIDYIVDTNMDETSDTRPVCSLIVRIYKNLSIKALVVDDSIVSQFVIQRELSLQKFQVLSAKSSHEALDVLAANQDIKLMLVDQQMDTMDGVSLVKKLRKQYAKDQLLIIGISTSADPTLAVKFLKAGANDFITKPFNYEILFCRINQNLDMLDAVEIAKHLSNTDYLSDVHNRRYFFERGAAVLKSLPKNGVITAMMFDIDHFKKINDTYGHDIGDEVIKHFSAQLKKYFDPDLIARLGGEEFAVLSLAPHYGNNFDYINKFRATIAAQTVSVKGHEIQYTCSIGTSSVTRPTIDDMMIDADRLLYKAKESGRNRVEGMSAVTENS